MPNQTARVNPIIDSFASVVAPNSRILDIGAGKGFLARAMAQRFDACVTIVDIARYNETSVPLTVCDSRALAFAENSFDYALLSFVLHHSPHPETILREALRVAPKVIVVENDVRGKLRGLVTRIVDSYPAVRHGTPPCHVTQNRNKWIELFRQFDAEVHVLSEFSLEFGFFQNFTVLLSRSE